MDLIFIRKGYRLDADYYTLITLLKYGYVQQLERRTLSVFIANLLDVDVTDITVSNYSSTRAK